jgi:hypothetical protein
LVSATVLLVGQASFTCAQQKVLIDFGSDASYRGLSVHGADANGHFWNSNTPGMLMPLVDVTNTPVVNNALPMQLGWISPVGTDSYNGPAGPTDFGTPASNLQYVVINAAALGDLGVPEAAFDFITGPNPADGGLGDGPGAGNPDNPAFQGPANATKFDLIGLDPAKKYTLIFYGAHSYNSDAVTTYSVFSDPAYTSQLGTVDLAVHHPQPPDFHGDNVIDPGFRNEYNQDMVATVSNLSPGADTNLYIKLIGATGYYGYLNSMEIIATTPAGVTGDYNGNGKVDAADYTIWRDHLGSTTYPLANRDTNNTGAISQSDYLSWKSHFGMGSGGSGAGSLSGAVPEPSSIVLGVLAILGLALTKHRRV